MYVPYGLCCLYVCPPYMVTSAKLSQLGSWVDAVIRASEVNLHLQIYWKPNDKPPQPFHLTHVPRVGDYVVFLGVNHLVTRVEWHVSYVIFMTEEEG